MAGERRSPARSDGEVLRLLVDEVPAMLAYWDADQRCRFANRAYQDWFGVQPGALIGKHASELLGPLYPLNHPHIEAVLRGEPQQFEREVPDPGGGLPRLGLVSYVPDVVEGQVLGFFVMVTDISPMKRAELALRESEERFRLTLDSAPIGMALVAPDGRFARVNHALCEIVGYSEAELTGLTFQAITHAADLDADVAQADRLRRGEISRYVREKRYLRKDGSEVEILLSVSALRAGDGSLRYFITQVEDIGERARLERELRLAEARASGILSISADAIICIDEAQRMTMFNEGAEQIFGYSRAEALGAPMEMIIPERFRARHRLEVEAFARGPRSARQMGNRVTEIFGLRKNGEEFPAGAAISKLDVGGKPVVTVALRDITEQKRIENEQRFLAEAGLMLGSSLSYEETLSKVAALAVREIADVCIVEVLGETGEIRRLRVHCRDPAKAATCAVLTKVVIDRSRPHLLRPVLQSRQPSLIIAPTNEVLDALSQSEEHRRALRDLGITSVVGVPMIAQGQLLGGIAFISTSSPRRYGARDVRLAEELAQRAALSVANSRLYREARRAAQARDDVLGIVAHDLRNPLSSILMNATVLRMGRAPSAEAHRERAMAIERAARRMNRLIQDLLDVTRADAGELRLDLAPVAAAQLLSDSLDAQRALAASVGIELRLDLAAELPAVLANRDRLLQVFENLLGNALKFTPRGGRVAVGAAAREHEVLFWVADTGQGIAADALPHVFDRFWKARKADAQGAGLGLPIVKGIVEAHRGRIWVESVPGEGTTFSFTIPIARPATLSPTEPAPPMH